MSSQLTDAENKFFLGLYRNAVTFYQRGIEMRTGFRLGEIRIRPYNEIDEDFIRGLEGVKRPWLLRLLGGAISGSGVQRWRHSLEATYEERARGCVAAYYNRGIYVSFAVDVRYHEEYLGMVAVHELAHALWEKIEGESPHSRRLNAQERSKFRLLFEGYATYAERHWFVDLYPPNLRQAVSNAPLDERGINFQGMCKTGDLVKDYGSQILFELPRRWRTIDVEASAPPQREVRS